MDAASVCSDLVKIRSENPPGDTRDCAEYIGDFLEEIGVPVFYTYGEKDETNVCSKNQSHELLINGHIDVVPALSEGWEHDPYSGMNDGIWVYGRGSSDMKGGVAAVLAAAKRIADAGETPDVSFAFVCDEEGGGPNGTRRLIAEHLIHPCDCLIAEPTPAHAPCIGQKGLFRATVQFTGEPAHSSLYPITGTSAVMQAAEFLVRLKVLHAKTWPVSRELEEILSYSAVVAGESRGAEGGRDKDMSQIFRHISYNPGVIRGGERANIVAQKCEVLLDMRLPWGVTADEITRELQTLLPRNAKIVPVTASDASLTSPDSRLVQTVCECVGRAYGISCRPMVQWAASDARALRCAGFNAVEYGPGELETIHGVNERVGIDQLNLASSVYEDVIRRYQ